jgi:hypothetical protein
MGVVKNRVIDTFASRGYFNRMFARSKSAMTKQGAMVSFLYGVKEGKISSKRLAKVISKAVNSGYGQSLKLQIEELGGNFVGIITEKISSEPMALNQKTLKFLYELSKSRMIKQGGEK